MSTDRLNRKRTPFIRALLGGRVSWVVDAVMLGREDAKAAQSYHSRDAGCYEKVGSLIRSFFGIDSSGCPALRQAVNPPTITNVLNPLSCSRCATRALVPSRAQVQYR